MPLYNHELVLKADFHTYLATNTNPENVWIDANSLLCQLSNDIWHGL